MRDATDRLIFYRALEKSPYDYDFFQSLRRIECLNEDKPRLGRASRPADEPVRLGQEVSMSFAPAPIAAFGQGEGDRVPRLEQRIFGSLGPNGPLPLHLTEVKIEQFVGHWMRLPAGDRTRLGSGTAGAQLGIGAVLGSRVWDRRRRFRVRFGPLTLAEYEAFLPGGKALPRLVALVRQYLCSNSNGMRNWCSSEPRYRARGLVSMDGWAGLPGSGGCATSAIRTT